MKGEGGKNLDFTKKYFDSSEKIEIVPVEKKKKNHLM